MMNVLVTGGAGFLGRGILRRANEFGWNVTVYSRDENKQEECRRRYPEARYILGDVRDTHRLEAAMVGHDTVIHAGAIKFVDRAELNAAETVDININGSISVIQAARSAGVERVVGISTDKAVQPVNIYGASKMAMERLFSEASQPEHTEFLCVRYGNVVGSTGSVIPLFQRQYGEQGKVFVTNPRMSRFWMSVDEAIKLIRTALAVGQPGSIVIPLVKAMTMGDVVLAAVGEVPIEIIGERPGEKEHEYLIHYQESVRVMRHKEYFELLPPGHTAGTEPFTLSSISPHFWMTSEEMKELIEDAATV